MILIKKWVIIFRNVHYKVTVNIKKKKYMKNLKPIYLFLLLACLWTGCSKEGIEDTREITELASKNQSQNNNNQVNPPIRSKNKLIVSFRPNTSPSTRDTLRSNYGVIRYETCNCGNDRIEKWEVSPGVDVEERTGDIAQETDVEGVDYEYLYSNENIAPNLSITEPHSTLITNMVRLNNTGVNIAVLDTGINLNILPDTGRFLYNSNINTNNCTENNTSEISGWDFVNYDNDPFDELGHGTAVISRIKNKLENEGVSSYSILPVKVFNHLGKGTTFNILCGYLYTVKKENIHLINMSFGWSGAPSHLLNLYISENNHILHITSAGNSDLDNDSNLHYPSSITANNLLAIGSYEIRTTRTGPVIRKSSFSNYGRHTVDYLSKGQDIYFQDANGINHPITGTSYAAPFVTAIAAKYYDLGYHTHEEISLKIWENATIITNNFNVFFDDRIVE